MVKKGHEQKPIVPVQFRNVRRPRSEIEVLRLSRIVRRAGAGQMGRVERLDFHLLALFISGRCRHTIDFQPYPCGPGSVLHVRPGQVHRWDIQAGLEAVILVFKPSFLLPEQGRGRSRELPLPEDWPAAFALGEAARAPIQDWFLKLEAIYGEIDESPTSTALMRHLLSVLLLDLTRRLGLGPDQSNAPPTELRRLQAFKRDVERSFRVTRRALDYAEGLRCSAKTLDRGCRAFLGTSAKAYIDGRVILEAKRMLAHTRLSVAEIGEELGFSEPTNFVKFFKARAGLLPGAFRDRQGQL